jgi:DNA-directed RNA polymerase II subunit RPB1
LPEDAYKILSKIRFEDEDLMGVRNCKNLIIKKLIVAPPAVRPSVAMGGGSSRSEDDLTYIY